MKPLKKNDSDNNIYLYVAFHVPLDISPSASGVRLRKTIEDVFDIGEHRLEFISHTENGGEIIYRFQKPLLMSDIENKSFFDKLNTIFVASAAFNPHFTQNNLV